MRFVLQRVSKASVLINKETTEAIGGGLVVFMGIHQDDSKTDCDKWIQKILKLRLFADDQKPINRSIKDVDGQILLISQFTLYADCQGQNRPSFRQAANPELAQEIYNYFEGKLKQAWPQTKTGQFAAHMDVSLVNDGPVTIILE
ncbi:D-tyrosyl-tRNA(Tyr) deacylase [bacterium K02(2017)]|nr:D-tyrosyl-tRNA(Tyr) deacylase [bacterium K02(2017)]